jgi:hypothetical protein
LHAVEHRVAVGVGDDVGVTDEDDPRLVRLPDRRLHRLLVKGQDGHRLDTGADPVVDLGDLLVGPAFGEALQHLIASCLPFELGTGDERLVDVGGAVGLTEGDLPLDGNRCCVLGGGIDPAAEHGASGQARAGAEDLAAGQLSMASR